MMGLFYGHIAFMVVDFLTEVDYQEIEDVISTIEETIDNIDIRMYYHTHQQFDNCYCRYCTNEVLLNNAEPTGKLFAKRYFNLQRHPDFAQALKTTNNQHRVKLELFRTRKKREVQDYIQYVHYSKESAVIAVNNNIILGLFGKKPG